jgi:DNA-binding transcriptional MerR regulator
MDDPRKGLLSIGTFAQLSRLSQKALRLYAQFGFLEPAYVDPQSGYRYYSLGQVRTARLVSMLRRMDMPLATVRQVVEAAPADAETLVRGYLALERERLKEAEGVGLETIRFLKGEHREMTTEVSVKTIPAQPVLSITGNVKVADLDNFIQKSLERLHEAATAGGVREAGPPFGLYHGPINNEEDGPIEVCLPVSRAEVQKDGIAAKEMPGAQVASVTLRGEECSFPHVLKGYDAVFDWVERNGYSLEGSPREIWHTGPIDPAEMEVALPFGR